MNARRELVKSLAQSTHLIRLYQAGHPVPAAALKDARLRLAEVLTEENCRDVVIGKADGRWLVNGAALPDAAAGLVFSSGYFGEIAADKETPPDLHQRAQLILAVIDARQAAPATPPAPPAAEAPKPQG